MSIPVDPADLERTMADFGPGYLLTVSANHTVKAVTVEPRVAGDVVVVTEPGKGTLANVAGNARVTLLFPPREEKGFTLLVDGTAATEGADVRVTPTNAVLHRPAAHADGPPPPGDCGHDCHPVG